MMPSALAELAKVAPGADAEMATKQTPPHVQAMGAVRKLDTSVEEAIRQEGDMLREVPVLGLDPRDTGGEGDERDGEWST
jgi:nitroreductase